MSSLTKIEAKKFKGGNIMAKDFGLTDEQVEQEIERLNAMYELGEMED